MYNDISAMSRLHRSAAEQMSGIAISLSKNGGWTFGSPSVLMMFHRSPGELAKELAEMDECMPHYYKVTDGHGMGAERIMRAEALLMQGRFDDSRIELESAYPVCAGNGQTNMTLCCDFTGVRLTLFCDVRPRGTLAQRYEELINHHNIAYVNIWNATCAYYYALTGETERIPEIFREHRLGTVNILAPGRPMHEMIENQVYLVQGDYVRVIGRCEGLLKVCEELHYALVALHLLIQSAAAYEMMGKAQKSDEYLKKAMELAEPDSFFIPFVENYRYIKEALARLGDASFTDFAARIKESGTDFEERINNKKETSARPSALAILTRREYDIVTLMEKRLTNKEIADKLFLSEGSVKQYINQIFSKLEIDGDRRTKRERLFELYHQNV
jgi:DNA-binding CsgD family transcriptional regulator